VLKLWELLLQRIPVVNSIYSSVKQVSDTLLSSSGNAFRKALLVQYPREGVWTIAFQTGVPGGDVKNHLVGDYVSVYVPTTPNPTSGFFLMLPRSDVIELEMSVDEALKYIVSMGVVAPSDKKTNDGSNAEEPLTLLICRDFIHVYAYTLLRPDLRGADGPNRQLVRLGTSPS